MALNTSRSKLFAQAHQRQIRSGGILETLAAPRLARESASTSIRLSKRVARIASPLLRTSRSGRPCHRSCGEEEECGPSSGICIWDTAAYWPQDAPWVSPGMAPSALLGPRRATLKTFGGISQLGLHLRHRDQQPRTRSSGAISASVRQCAACCRNSLGVATRSMKSPSVAVAPREDVARLKRRQGSLATCGTEKPLRDKENWLTRYPVPYRTSLLLWGVEMHFKRVPRCPAASQENVGRAGGLLLSPSLGPARGPAGPAEPTARHHWPLSDSGESTGAF